MWSQIGLCLLVCFAFASTNPGGKNNPGWKDNTEYVYRISGRTLASLHEVANQYSGILLKAKLVIQAKPDGKLNGRISDAQYAQIQSQLPNDWNTHIPDAELSYKPLGLSTHPFQIEMVNGVIRDVIVNREVPNWEANIIKSIMSQFQMDTNLQSRLGKTGRPEDESSYVFKTMEETITGNTETSYDIHHIPEYTLQEEEWASRLSHLKGDGDIFEVVKNKNYSNNMELPSYHYGFAGMGDWKPATNQMGNFFIRSSIGRAILTGKLDRYTLHNSYTVNKIMMSPTLTDKQKGSVVSFLEVTLEDIKSQGENIGEVSNPVRLGGLVYTFDDPFSNSKEAGQRKSEDRKYVGMLDNEEYERYQRSATNMEKLSGTAKKMENIPMDMDNSYWHTNKILRRSYNPESYGDSSEYWQSGAFYKQNQPKMNEVPDFPLLPYTTGNHGKSIKQDRNVDVIQSVKKLAQSIGKTLQDPEDSLRQNALSQFIIMNSLIRIMKTEELQQVASELYTQSINEGQHDSWVAFRDGVAKAGTGPAFLTIKNWIETKKIKGYEAAHIISEMSRSVRVPTAEYIQSFFDLIRKPEVETEEYLNETALMSFTKLIRKVYVDSKLSKNEYPVKTFGSFRTNEGMKIVEGVILHLTQKLHETVSRGDVRQIHVYIRCLGNVAHPDVLSAFEPYLEGKKQASQFQRLLMVVAMDKLAETYPEQTRSVLFNIYQNAGETQEVRVAAVYQLMRTSPPTSMLQRMASYTNIDPQEYVNAAVKTSIESAADLEGTEYHHLRWSALGAKHLLTNKRYGIQHGANYLRDYVIDELKVNFKQTVQSIGSEDEYYPKGIQYSLRANLGGLRSHLVKVKAMVSSIQELVHIGKLQTASYNLKMEEQQRNLGEQQQQQFSSQNIAQLLNLEGDEKEQLEGNLYMEFDDYFQQIFSFDNHTVEQWSQVIRKYEEELGNGKKFCTTKLINRREIAMSFPTEMGFPFLFTYDTPALLKLNGKLKGAASSRVSQDNKLHLPDTVSFKSEMEVTVNYKIQSHLSFFTPFDHQQYFSGFDKNLQVHIPLYGTVEVDFKNGQLTAELNPDNWHKNKPLFHYSTWPYTSRADIRNFLPISLQQNTHYIRQENLRTYEDVFGKKETGMAWHVKIHHERESVSLSSLYNLLHKNGVFGSLCNLWDDASIQHSEIEVRHLSDKSSTRKCIVRMGFQHEYRPQFQGDGTVNQGYWDQYSQISELLARRKFVIDKLSAGINNADVTVGEISIEFQGEKNLKHIIAGGCGRSNVDPKSRVLGYYKRTANYPDGKPYEIELEVNNQIPNTNGLDLSYTMEHEPKVDSEFHVRFGQNRQAFSEIEGRTAFRRSENRKRYLQEQPLYQQCQREMRRGNYQFPGCANYTMDSNLLDEVHMNIQYKKLRPDVMETVEAVYSALKVNYYPFLRSYKNQGTGKQNDISLKARFDPDLRSVNFSLKTSDEETTVNDIKVGENGRTLFVLHPVFHVRSRIMSRVLGLHTYRPICVVDRSYISTFNNRTYPASLDDHWTVVLQYVPKDGRHGKEPSSVQEQLKSQIENYVVLTRQNPQRKQDKDIKITVSSPETGYKLKDITLSSGQEQGSGKRVKVSVNGQEVTVEEKKSHDIADGYVQVYSLPNGEVKVEVRDAFYVICDGQRMKLTVLNGKFRDSIRGLCGAFNVDDTSDFLTPQGCIVGDYQKFIKSYDIDSTERGQQNLKLNNKECVPKDMPLYTNVISGRGWTSQHLGSTNDCNKVQTRYVEQNGEICFTTREMPVCGKSCQARDYISKTVSVHCLKSSNAAQLWKNQIDQGLSPSFGHKQATKNIILNVPQGCVPY